MDQLKKLIQLFQRDKTEDENYFDDDGSHSYLIFQPVFEYFQIFSSIVCKMLGWKSKGLSQENITTPATSDNSFTPKLTYNHNSKIAVKFEGNCVKQ